MEFNKGFKGEQTNGVIREAFMTLFHAWYVCERIKKENIMKFCACMKRYVEKNKLYSVCQPVSI